MAGFPSRNPNENTLGSLLGSAFAPVGDFLSYETNPEAWLTKPNQRVRPGIMDGYQYSMQPGESVDDGGRYYGADGQPLEFVDRPALAELLNLYPPVGSVAAPMKGAEAVLGAGPILRATPSYLPDLDPTAVEGVAQIMEAARKRGPMGRHINSWEAADQADNAMMTLSGPPSQSALAKAEKAMAIGFDTPMFHLSGHRYGDVPGGTGSIPFLVPDVNYGGLGAIYTGSTPSSIFKSGAHVGSGGDAATAYGVMVRSPTYGEHAFPDELAAIMPDRIRYNGDTPSQQSIQDILAGIATSPYRQEVMDKALRDRVASGVSLEEARAQFAHYQPKMDALLANEIPFAYYPQETGGYLLGPEEFRPVSSGQNQPGVPDFASYELGAKPTKPSLNQPGANSFMQNTFLGMGFPAARVADDVGLYKDGKTIAVHEPTAIRSVNAKFNPKKAGEADMLAGVVPPGWFANLFQSDTQEPRL